MNMCIHTYVYLYETWAYIHNRLLSMLLNTKNISRYTRILATLTLDLTLDYLEMFAQNLSKIQLHPWDWQ
jgi:hypothetical protein